MPVDPFALTEGVPETRVAQRLVEARRSAGFTRLRASRAAGVSRSNIVRIEKGRMRPPDGTLIALCRTYGVTITWLIPERSGNLVEVTPAAISVAGRSLPLSLSPPKAGDDPDVDVVLRSYLCLVRELRGVASGMVVNLRDEDLVALAQALGDTPAEIEARLVDLMMLSRDEARAIRRELVKRRVGAPAAGLLLATAAFTTTLDNGPGPGLGAGSATSAGPVPTVGEVMIVPAGSLALPSAGATSVVAPSPAASPPAAVVSAAVPPAVPVAETPAPPVAIGDAFYLERPDVGPPAAPAPHVPLPTPESDGVGDPATPAAEPPPASTPPGGDTGAPADGATDEPPGSSDGVPGGGNDDQPGQSGTIHTGTTDTGGTETGGSSTHGKSGEAHGSSDGVPGGGNDNQPGQSGQGAGGRGRS